LSYGSRTREGKHNAAASLVNTRRVVIYVDVKELPKLLQNRPNRILVWVGIWSLLLELQIIAVLWAMQMSGQETLMSVGKPKVPEALSAYTGEPISLRQQSQRPLAAMIASDPIARPQSGLSAADVVVEMEAAPGITRLLAIFQSELPKEIGSIRSARNDYIDIAEGFDSVLVHWGGEKRALDRLAVTDTPEIDQFANGDLFYRDPLIPAPHNGFTSGELLQQGLERYDYAVQPTFNAWHFTQPVAASERPTQGQLDITYGNPDFNVEWAYDATSNSYLRSQGGSTHLDRNNETQISASNVLVVRASYFVYQQQGGYLQFDIQSGGECSLYQNGLEIPCQWTKGDEHQPLVVTKPDSKEVLPFVVGPTWIQVVLPTAAVEWEAELVDNQP
jgi:hypothetical protein